MISTSKIDLVLHGNDGLGGVEEGRGGVSLS